MNRIRIHLGASGWLATYEGPHAATIIELFDTATIPTAFTREAPLPAVVKRLGELNPGVDVAHWLEG